MKRTPFSSCIHQKRDIRLNTLPHEGSSLLLTIDWRVVGRDVWSDLFLSITHQAIQISPCPFNLLQCG